METVLYEKRDRIPFVTLNRPEAKNAIDSGIHDKLCRIWRDFRDDDGLDVAMKRFYEKVDAGRAGTKPTAL